MPVDVFLEWLAARPNDARVVVASDADRLLAETGVLGKPVVVDQTGRDWQAVVFRGDDLAFRLTFRKAAKRKRTVIVLTRGTASPATEDVPQPAIDVSYLADILAQNEGGTPLDLSVPAFFRRICPKINFPVTELRRYKDALLTDLAEIPKATAKIVERWGRPDDWGRGQVAALVILAHHPSLTLGEIWPDETDAGDFLAHALRIVLAEPLLSDDRTIVLEMIREAARPQAREDLFWLDCPPEELAAYLVLRAFAQQARLQNPSTQLAGLHILPMEMPLAKMEPLALAVATRLQADPKAWAAVESLADRFLTARRLSKVFDLLPAKQPLLKGAGVSPVILFHQVRTALLSFFEQPSLDRLSWAAGLSDHPLLASRSSDLSARAAQCRAALQFLLGVLSVEQRLATVPPSFPHADALLDWYVEHRNCPLELETACVAHDLESCEEEELADAGRQYLFGGADDQNPSEESLKGRVRARLHALDAALAGFVAANPDKFARGPRSILGYLNKTLKPKLDEIVAGQGTGRLWVLIFDGMRFDTWNEVVQPLLAEHFDIKAGACFCVLPSFTQIARTSLLAGCLSHEWQGYRGSATKDEATLVARNLGLTAQEVKSKLRFVTEADTTKARMAMGASDAAAKEVNVLIYPVSDECHDFKGDLAAFNRRIRTEIIGDRAQGGARGILDDLLRRIRPDDTAVVVSDHGFTELLTGDGIVVAQAETTQENVSYRYVRDHRPADAPDAIEIANAAGRHFLAVGRKWFRREDGKVTARYSHGGLSLAEVVVPAAALTRITAKAARAELESLPAAVTVPEDETAELSLPVRNSGNTEVEFELTVRTNLADELLAHRGRLSAGATFKANVHVRGKYRPTIAGDPDPTATTTAIAIRLRHTDLKGAWRDATDGTATIPVNVQAKAGKLDTDALKGLDDI
jgi:hypothetical protein